MSIRGVAMLAATMSAGLPGLADAADAVTLVQSVPHLTTTGYAAAVVVPDQADITLGVANERPTVAEASDATAKGASDVVDSVKAQGIDARDIKTSFSLGAVYDEDRDPRGVVQKRTLRGYRAEENVTIRLRDTSKVGGLSKMLIEKGANAFRGVTFSYSKERSKRRELDAEAMRDALAEAKIYTDAIGVKLGRPLQIGGDLPGDLGTAADLPSRAPMPYTTAATVVIPTEPGTQVVMATISVVWEIKGSAP